jgi:UDP-N-acetyl-2-amino-2-deoxyglucuronate dehydrogenase
MQLNFILIGVGGYVAPRHLAAIKAVGGNLLAALDKHDSVGVLDSWFPDCDFFTEFEIFDRHCTMLVRTGTPIHYCVVCSPNYLHDAHCRFGIRIGADVICEKPLVLNPSNAVALQEVERETGRRVWCILQLRLHPVVIGLKRDYDWEDASVKLTYVTARGKWYEQSWKGSIAKSGGIAANIGIHFFDMLLWLFGDVVTMEADYDNKNSMYGNISLKNADVDWSLSTDIENIPVSDSRRSYRKLTIDGIEFDLTDGFADLHTKSYQEIIAGRGFGIEDALPAIRLVHEINQ